VSPDPVDPMQFARAIGELLRNPWVWTYVAGIATGWKLARHATRYMLGGRL
jgi:hypothetical protein